MVLYRKRGSLNQIDGQRCSQRLPDSECIRIQIFTSYSNKKADYKISRTSATCTFRCLHNFWFPSRALLLPDVGKTIFKKSKNIIFSASFYKYFSGAWSKCQTWAPCSEKCCLKIRFFHLANQVLQKAPSVQNNITHLDFD